MEELLGSASFLCASLWEEKKKKSHPKVSDDDESFKTFEAVVLEEVVGSQNP